MACLKASMLSALPTVIVIAVIAGCQKYEPWPLDPDAHRSEWASRVPGHGDVAAFAAALSAAQDPSAARPYDPADGLSLEEAEVVALVFNPQIRVARRRANVAEVSAELAGLWDDPVFDLDVLRIVESVPDPWIVGGSVGFTIPLSGRLDAQKRSAAAEQYAALARVAQQEWELLTQLREAWLEWSSTQLQAEVTSELVERLSFIASVADRLERVGELSHVESRLFQIEVAMRANEARAFEAQAAGLALRIKSIMGVRPDAPVAMEPALSVPTLSWPAGSEFERMLEATSPALAVVRSEYEIAEQRLHREIRVQYPDLAIGPAYENEEGQSRIGLVGSLPIPILNRNRRDIAEARAEREAARAVYEAEYEGLVHQVALARLDLDYRAELRSEIEATLIPLVEDQVRDAQRMIELGEIDTLVQLESVVRRGEAKSQLVEARLAEALAANRIRALVGPEQAGDQEKASETP